MVTQTDIDNLNTAIANDARQVTLGGQSVTYRSIDDLIKARNDLQGQLDAANPTPRRPRRIFGVYAGRGFQSGGCR